MWLSGMMVCLLADLQFRLDQTIQLNSETIEQIKKIIALFGLGFLQTITHSPAH